MMSKGGVAADHEVCIFSVLAKVQSRRIRLETFGLSLVWFQVDALSARDGFSQGKVGRKEVMVCGHIYYCTLYTRMLFRSTSPLITFL